jgi:hypothetical protein
MNIFNKKLTYLVLVIIFFITLCSCTKSKPTAALSDYEIRQEKINNHIKELENKTNSLYYEIEWGKYSSQITEDMKGKRILLFFDDIVDIKIENNIFIAFFKSNNSDNSFSFEISNDLYKKLITENIKKGYAIVEFISIEKNIYEPFASGHFYVDTYKDANYDISGGIELTSLGNVQIKCKLIELIEMYNEKDYEEVWGY